MSENPDLLDDLLRPETSVPAPIWKDTLREQTTRTLRRRRRGRHVTIIAALGACFLAGVLTTRLFSSPQIVHDIEYVSVPAESTPDTPAPPSEKPANQEKLTALALEWQAAESPDRSAELNRLAGDRYVEEENDLESAIRCYKRFLAECTHEELEITPKDNWLLVTLKSARLEERRHAKSNG
jgi:hypothetical protein